MTVAAGRPRAPSLEDFVRESNAIEGITREPTEVEVVATFLLVSLNHMFPQALEDFVRAVEPRAELRTRAGLDVWVGDHLPPPGGLRIASALDKLVLRVDANTMTPFEAHCAYETLHPFTDCNGRSGRALWYWHMLRAGQRPSLGFLHHFYYQALSAARG